MELVTFAKPPPANEEEENKDGQQEMDYGGDFQEVMLYVSKAGNPKCMSVLFFVEDS